MKTIFNIILHLLFKLKDERSYRIIFWSGWSAVTQ